MAYRGPISGPPGSASYVVDPTGARRSRLDSLSMVHWWLAVVLKKKILFLVAGASEEGP